jgi:hypothetical protein
MMDESGKSDSAVVPMKSPNNAGSPAAEAMEGRGLTKGNSTEHGTPRTQSRNSVPSALDRVPQVTKSDGRLRPLGVPTLEDKVVQRSVVEVMGAIYEQDFLGLSYRFRPGRSAHLALRGSGRCRRRRR